MWSWCNVAYHQHTKPSYLFVCPCVPTLHKALNQKKQERRSTCCYFLMLLLLEMLLSSLLLPWGGPPPQVQPRLLCCRYVANVSFLFFWKRTGSRREKEKALNLVFFFSCPSLNLVFLFPHWIWERERHTHTHTHTCLFWSHFVM